jgi:hypothetical protein
MSGEGVAPMRTPASVRLDVQPIARRGRDGDPGRLHPQKQGAFEGMRGSLAMTVLAVLDGK